MANLSLSSVCNRSCSYCFARPVLDARPQGPQFMPLNIFTQALDFLERSGVEQVVFLGGEPTLHPQFIDLAQMAMDRNFDLQVFSNGLMPGEVLDYLCGFPSSSLKVLINTAVPGEWTEKERKQQLSALARLGERAGLGINLPGPALDPGFLLPLIEEYQLAPVIRLGLAHPGPGGTNQYARPKHYAAIGRRLLGLAQEAQAQGVELEFDCGFVPCMFRHQDLELLGPRAGDLGLRCNPILDILPGGGVIACYPLADQGTLDMGPEETDLDLREEFTRRLAPQRTLGVFKECQTCRLREQGECLGGCLAAASRRWRRGQTEISAPPGSVKVKNSTAPCPEGGPRQDTAAEGEALKWMLPYVDQPLGFWHDLHQQYGPRISGVYFPLDRDVIASGRPALPELHLQDFLKESPFALNALLNPVILARPAREAAPALIEELRRLQGQFGLQCATVSNLNLAILIKQALPQLSLTASCLMDISTPLQTAMLGEVCDTLVPSGRIMRNPAALKALKQAFNGRIRLIANEACLPGCPFRTQHFYEMAGGTKAPASLCQEMLEEKPWLRLTGSWVLPQHLQLFAGLCHEWKLAGRATLQDPEKYWRVLRAYLEETPLMPHEIGGGPASPLFPLEISRSFYEKTLDCGQACTDCSHCQDYYARSQARTGEETPLND